MVLIKHTMQCACILACAILTPIVSFSQALQVNVDLLLNISCNGNNDGAVFLVASQGTPPYFYAWSNFETSPSVVNLSPGSYSCTVTDSGNEEVVINVEITEPSPVGIEVDTVVRPDCQGQNGLIRVFGEGGTPPYTYFWSNNATTNEINFPAPGFDFGVTITDNNNCTASMKIDAFVQLPPTPQFENIPAVTCKNPTPTLIPFNQSPLFLPSWTAGLGGTLLTPPNQFQMTVGSPGTYTLSYTLESNGCSRDTTFTVGEDTDPPLVDAGNDQTWQCSGDGGQLTGSVSSPGGNPVSWTWQATGGGKFLVQGQEQDTTSLLSPMISRTGTYILTGTDLINGCSASDTVVIGSVNQAPLIQVQNTFISCTRDTITLTATYDTLNTLFEGWTGPNGFNTLQQNPKVTVPGNYTVTVTDTLNGCTGKAVLTVGINTTIPALVLPAGVDTLSCQQPLAAAGVNTDTIYNNAPYSYQWNGPFGLQLNDRNVFLTAPGTFTVIVTDTINGCTNSGNIQVEADPSFVIANAGGDTVLTCTHPTLTLDGNGSSQGFEYSWTTPDGNIVSGANTLTPVIDAPGTYTLEVTDPVGGCVSSDEVVVTADQDPPVVTATGGTINCTEPTVDISGSVAPADALIMWSGPGGFSSDLLENMVDVPGSYILTASAANGCTASATANVAADTLPPALSVNNDTLTCVSAQAELTATTPGSPSAFAWSGPNGFTATGESIQVGQPGAYIVTATNNTNGCTAVDTAMVTLNANLPTANAGPDDFLNCNVDILKLNGSGSTLGGGISYEWTTPDGNIISGETTLSPRVDEPGIYILTVLNTANGCFSFDTMLVIQRPPVSVSIDNVQNVPCFGAASGLAIATAGGGTGMFQFGWSNGAQSATVSGLVAGTYSVLAIDSDGCTATAGVVITEPAELTANASATAETFGGQNDGTATAMPSGGTGPYTYEWSNNQTQQMINSLAPGTYTVTVTDANGCTALESVTVNASNCFLTASVSSTNLNCAGANDGSASITVNNAADPVSYEWSNGADQSSIQNLAPGTYMVTITDANSCSIVRTVNITSPQALSASIVAEEDVVCADADNGFLAASASGGTQPYTFAWSNGSSEAVATGLGVGSYTATVTDAKGCTQVLNGSISATDTVPPVVFVTDFLISLDDNGEVNLLPEYFVVAALDVDCEIAGMIVEPSTFGCDDVGFHIVNIIATDVNGNVTTKEAELVIVDNAFPILDCPDDMTVGLCNAIINYPTPTVTDNCTVDPGLLIRTSGLPSGTLFPVGTTVQTYSYTDNAGNTGQCVFSFTVLDLPVINENISSAACANDCNGQVTLSLSGNAPPYSVEWSNGDTNNTITNLCPGVYGYTVTDGADCKTVYSLTVDAVDNEAPVLNLQLAVANLDANGQVVLTADLFDNGSFDNCGIATWTVNPSNFSCSDIGTHVVTVTAVDSSGNSTSKDVQVIVADNTPPTLTCPPNIVVGACDNMVTFPNPGFSDNCSAVPADLDLISGLASGSIFPVGTTIQVFQATDASTNPGTCAFTVEVSGAPTLDAALVPATCNGLCNGAVNLNVSGGNGPLSFLWNTGQTTPSVSGLCAGPATISITDADGCQTIRTFLIEQPAPITVFVDDIMDDAGGAGLGSIQITVEGGTPPYGFSWTLNGNAISTNEDPTGLKKGYYIINITDANGCTFSRDSIYVDDIIAVQEPEWARGLTLAPNPATEQVRILFPETSGIPLDCQITDLSGRVVSSFSFRQFDRALTLQIADLPAGLWLLRLQSEDGGLVVRKLVKQ